MCNASVRIPQAWHFKGKCPLCAKAAAGRNDSAKAHGMDQKETLRSLTDRTMHTSGQMTGRYLQAEHPGKQADVLKRV